MMDLLNEMLPNKIWGAVEQWIVILIRGTEIYITFYPLHMHLQITLMPDYAQDLDDSSSNNTSTSWNSDQGDP